MRSVSIAVAVLGLACGSPQATPSPAPAPAPSPAPPPPVERDPDPPAAPQNPAPKPARRDDGKLLIEGAPEIPDALRRAMQPYLETRSASLAGLSADGKRALVLTRFGQTQQVHLLSGPGAARTQVTFRSEPVRQADFVPGSATALYYVADVGGDEKYQLYRLDLARNQTTLLTDGKSRNMDPVFSRDGRKLAFASNARNGRDFDIWVSDGKSAASARRVLETKGLFVPMEFSRDGKRLLVQQYVSINESRIHLLDLASGKSEPITPETPASAYRTALFSSTGRSVYLASDRVGEFRELYELELASKKWRPLSRGIPWDVENAALSPDGRTLAFTVNAGGISKLYTVNTASRKRRPVSGIPQGVLTGLRFAAKAPVLGFTLRGAASPGDAYTYRLTGAKRLTRWTRSELGGLSRKALVEPTLIDFSSFDGAKIPAFYYRPPGKGPFPVVVSIHGGPESQARPYFSSLTQFWVSERKVAVIYPNVRGSSGYGKSYLRLDNGTKREDSVKDIGALLDWIAKRPELDAKRVGVIGGSYGGYMVLASLVHYGERIRAGVDIVGISSFVTFLRNTGAYRRDLRRVEYGDERDPKMRAHLEKISPLGNADKIRSALFVVQGANDPRVPASEAEQIVAAVRRAQKPVWYMLARDEGHGFRKKKNRDAMGLLTVLFFDKNL